MKALLTCLFAVLALLGPMLLAGCEQDLTGPEEPSHALDTAIPGQAAVVLSTLDIIVNTTSDVADLGFGASVASLPGPDGLVSLREAIIAANNTLGPQGIGFNISTVGNDFDGQVFTIKPLSPLPPLLDHGTTIDGTTQALYSGNTNLFGPEIVVDGSVAGATSGIVIHQSDNHTIRGLVIHSFADTGIQFNEDATNTHPANVQIAGCFIGTDPTGSAAMGNGWQGVAEIGSNNLIGGPDPSDGNLISGNNAVLNIAEVQIDGSGTIVQQNLIGTDRTATVALGTATGIVIGRVVGSNNVLITGNLISGNAGAGVLVEGSISTGVTVSRNRIFSNDGLGIDLNGGGVTLNDEGDADSGPNGLMNFPVLASGVAGPVRLVVTGTIDTPNPHDVVIEFFATEAGGDPSGHGEGATFLGTARPNRIGRFTAILPPVQPGARITATATDVLGSTSEFAKNVVSVLRP